MSKENVEKFFDLAKSDKILAEKLMQINEEIHKGNQSNINDDYVIDEKIIPLAKENNLDFSSDDFLDYAKGQISELSDEDLENVNGGGATFAAFLLTTLLGIGGLSGIAGNFFSGSSTNDNTPENLQTSISMRYDKEEGDENQLKVEENNENEEQNFSENLEELKSIVNNLKEENNSLRNDNLKLSNSNKELQTNLDNQKQENESLRSNLSDNEIKNNELQEGLNNQLKENEGLKNNLEKQKSETLENKNKELNNLNNELKEKLDNQIKENENLKNNLENEIKELQENLKIQEGEKENLSNSNKELKEKLDNSLKADKDLNDIKKENNTLKEKLKEQEFKFTEESETARRAYKIELNKMSNETEKLIQKLKDSAEETRSLLADMEKIKQENANIQQENANIKSENQELKNELDNLRKENEALKQRSEKTRYKGSVEGISSSLDVQERELTKFLKSINYSLDNVHMDNGASDLIHDINHVGSQIKKDKKSGNKYLQGDYFSYREGFEQEDLDNILKLYNQINENYNI